MISFGPFGSLVGKNPALMSPLRGSVAIIFLDHGSEVKRLSMSRMTLFDLGVLTVFSLSLSLPLSLSALPDSAGEGAGGSPRL